MGPAIISLLNDTQLINRIGIGADSGNFWCTDYFQRPIFLPIKKENLNKKSICETNNFCLAQTLIELINQSLYLKLFCICMYYWLDQSVSCHPTLGQSHTKTQLETTSASRANCGGLMLIRN